MDSTKKRSDIISIKSYIDAAIELGFKVEVLEDDKDFFAIIKNGNKALRMVNNVPDFNGFISSKIAGDKVLLNRLLSKTFPEIIPRFKTFHVNQDSKKLATELFKLAKSLEYKVFKPSKGSNGLAIVINPKSEKELEYAINQIKEDGKSKLIMAEELINANKEYRIISWKGEIINVIERMPASIIGDGENTIEVLINQKSKYKTSIGMKPIEIDEYLKSYLLNKNITLKDVPTEGENIQLRSQCNFQKGGDVKKIDIKLIDSKFNEIVRRIQEITRLNWMGVDLMTDDITKAPNSRTKINEVNFSSGNTIVYFSDLEASGDPLKSTKEFLERIFSDL